jgi:hypothetical protein
VEPQRKPIALQSMSARGQERRWRPRQPNVRFYSTAGITVHRGEPPLGANCGLMQCSKWHRYSISSSARMSSDPLQCQSAAAIVPSLPYCPVPARAPKARAYRLKASNAAPSSSTSAGDTPLPIRQQYSRPLDPSSPVLFATARSMSTSP